MYDGQPIAWTRAPRCPACQFGYLIYPIEQRKARCIACQIRENGTKHARPTQRYPYRSEADAYGEGIYDDD